MYHFSQPVVVIHWTRQIKELLSSQESLDTSTSSGPLEEIGFWRARCEDYSSLTHQLDQPGVKKVIRIVQRAKSSYVEPFQKLSQQIQVAYTISFSVPSFSHVYVLVCYTGEPTESGELSEVYLSSPRPV